jgi:uncharacterized membrane-anchored protein YhcB (DUF1043 family)
MNMMLLVGVSVGFTLSVLTLNSFYAQKTFTASLKKTEWQLKQISGKLAQQTQLQYNRQ